MIAFDFEGHMIDLADVKPSEFTTAAEAKQSLVIYCTRKLCFTLDVLDTGGGEVEYQTNKPRRVYADNGTSHWENLSILTREYQGDGLICPVVSMCTCGMVPACEGLGFEENPENPEDIPVFNWNKIKAAEAIVGRGMLKLPPVFAIVAHWGDNYGDEDESSEIHFQPQE